MNNIKRVTMLFMLICTLFLSASSCDGGGGGGENNGGGRATDIYVDAEDCLSVKIDRIETSGSFSINIVGTVTNNCTSSVSMAVIKSYCYTQSGESIGPDLASVSNVAIGEVEDFDALIASVNIDPKKFTRCTSEIRDAFYDR